MNLDRMPRIAFFTFSEWAYGSIHKALIKELYKNGIQADIIDWSRSYTLEEMKCLNEIYDVFMTQTCDGLTVLKKYGISPRKILAVAHGRPDLQKGLSEGHNYDELLGYAGVSNDLERYSKKLGTKRDMTILQCGVDFEYFYRPISYGLKNIGYAGKFERPDEFDNIPDLKRGYLVKRIAEETNTPLIQTPHMTHLAMPAYYAKIDALMVSSVYESCSLPLLEAAAAGRLPISSPVGITQDLDNTPGFILPASDDEYVREGTNVINTMKADPSAHQHKCKQAQEYAREYYAWDRVISPWIKFIVEKL